MSLGAPQLDDRSFEGGRHAQVRCGAHDSVNDGRRPPLSRNGAVPSVRRVVPVRRTPEDDANDQHVHQPGPREVKQA